MSYLLDTCVISEIVTKQPNPVVLDWIEQQSESDLYLSVITIGEIAKGIHKLSRSPKRQKLTHWLYKDLLQRFQNRTLKLDTEILLRWGELLANIEKIGRNIPLMDSLIAATCLQHKLILVTRNEKDFQGCDLEILNPWNQSSSFT